MGFWFREFSRWSLMPNSNVYGLNLTCPSWYTGWERGLNCVFQLSLTYSLPISLTIFGGRGSRIRFHFLDHSTSWMMDQSTFAPQLAFTYLNLETMTPILTSTGSATYISAASLQHPHWSALKLQVEECTHGQWTSKKSLQWEQS